MPPSNYRAYVGKVLIQEGDPIMDVHGQNWLFQHMTPHGYLVVRPVQSDGSKPGAQTEKRFPAAWFPGVHTAIA